MTRHGRVARPTLLDTPPWILHRCIWRSARGSSLAARNLSVAKTLVFPAIHIEYWRHLFFTVTPGLFVDRLYNIARTLSEHRQLTDEWLRDARLVQLVYDLMVDDNVNRYFVVTMGLLSEKIERAQAAVNVHVT